MCHLRRDEESTISDLLSAERSVTLSPSQIVFNVELNLKTELETKSQSSIRIFSNIVGG